MRLQSEHAENTAHGESKRICRMSFLAQNFDRNGQEIMRNGACERVPPKMGFGVPLEYWLGGDNGLRDLANRLADAHPRKRFYSPVRKDALDTLTGGHVDEDFSQEIWGLLFLEKWWQRNFV